MFDHGIILDYRSTDRSVEICKQICPTWEIRTTRNSFFDAIEIDKEFMDIENNINGIKIILNTTEFLFCDKSIREIFNNYPGDIKSLAVNAISPYSIKEYNPPNLYELLNNLLSDDIVFKYDRGVRQIHNYRNGNYNVGRHTTNNNTILINDMHIIWFGYYPLNDNLINRKLQIKNNIPDGDKQKGLGFQHLFEKDKILLINVENSNNGEKLININNDLHYLLYSKTKDL